MDDPKNVGNPDTRLSRPVGERRQVTTLYYDIVNSTALLNTLDPEDFGNAQRHVHMIAATAIQRHGGFLDQITGDGGCAFFGYPIATEDAAEGAVAAGLEIIRLCLENSVVAEDAPPIHVRVGIATGTVIVSDTTVTGLPAKREIVGLAVHLASRLQAFAAPDTVLVSDAAYRLTQAAFDYSPVAAIELKGFTEPQRVWKPTGRRDVESSFAKRRRSDTPFIARTSELELGRTCWIEAQQGGGRALFVTGEAGIGKSRLASELLRETEGAACDRRVFQCQPRGNRRPFHAFIDRLFREIRQLRGQETCDATAIRDYIVMMAPGISEESVDVLSTLADAGSDLVDSIQSPLDAPGEEFGRAALDAMMEVLSAWSRMRPQFIVLEDFQWSDALMRALVARALDDIGRLRIMLLVTSRDPPDPELLEKPSVIVRSLSKLTSNEIAQLVECVWETYPLPRELPGFIEEQSGGIPLFAEELTHFLREQCGGEKSGRSQWEQLLRRDGVSSLKDVLLARITAPVEARRVAQIASVIGREFSHQMLAAISEDIPAETLERHLESLIKRDIIYPVGNQESASYRFRHVLFQEAAYDSLLRSEQRELHNRIIASSTGEGSTGHSDEMMAWHCEQAGRFREAAQYAIRAAEKCAARSAVHEAWNLLASAESCIAHLEPGWDSEDLTLKMLAIRGPVEMALFGTGSPEACCTYERAITLCRQKGPTDREQWFPLYWGWWMTSPNAEAVVRSRIIVSDLESASDPEIELQALHCSWATHFHAGHHHECLHCIERGLSLYDPERAVTSRTRYGGHDARVCALAERGQSLWFRGDPVRGAESVREALRWAEEIDHLGSICHALDVSLLFNHFEGNLSEVLRLSERLRELANKYALPNCEAKCAIFSGWAHALSGLVEEGRALFERGFADQLQIGTQEDLPIYLDMRAATLERAFRDDLALLALEEAVDHASRTSNVFWLPELYRRRAVVGERCGRTRQQVLQDLENALALAQKQGAETLVRRVRADMFRSPVHVAAPRPR